MGIPRPLTTFCRWQPAGPGFTLPGDTSASNRYYAEDVTEPFVLQDGLLTVPTGPGIGVDPIPENLASMSVNVVELTAE